MKKIIALAIATLAILNANAQELSFFGAASYLDNGVKPLIGVSYGDQIAHSGRFSFEVSAAGVLREYNSKSTSAGLKYASLRMMGMVKYSPFKTEQHTINMVAGLGTELSKDDYKLIYEDRMGNGVEYPCRYSGFTPVVNAGLEYKYTFKSGNALGVKLMAEYGNNVLYGENIVRWGATGCISYSFAL